MKNKASNIRAVLKDYFIFIVPLGLIMSVIRFIAYGRNELNPPKINDVDIKENIVHILLWAGIISLCFLIIEIIYGEGVFYRKRCHNK